MIRHLEGLFSLFKIDPTDEDSDERYSDEHLMSLVDSSEDANIRMWAEGELERRKSKKSLKKRREK